MLLNVRESLQLGTTTSDAWRLLRDTARLAKLVPGVDSVVRLEAHWAATAGRHTAEELLTTGSAAPLCASSSKDPEREAYRVQVTEKVGPFKVTMKLDVTMTEVVDLFALGATVKGGDVTGMTRATGPIRVELGELPGGTSLTLTVNVEVLGKLATLGAPVIRRRVAELFKEFGERVVAEFQSIQS